MDTPIIDENLKGEDDTFIGQLHEDCLFSTEFFWPLYDEINALSGFYVDKSKLPKDLSRKLFKMQGFILSNLTCHFNPNDLYEIINLTEVNHRSFRKRLEYLFEYFGVQQLPESMFDDELR